MGRFVNKIRDLEHSLGFGDILIKPAFSSVVLSEIDFSLKLNENLVLKLPIFSAAMDTVTGYEMARKLISLGGCAPLNKNIETSKKVEYLKKLVEEFGLSKPIAVAVGVGNTYEEIDLLIKSGANVVVVDSAHAYSERVGVLVEYISKKYPDIFLIAGNIVTKEAAEYLIEKGAKAVKIGMGCGSICTTRKVTGIGRGSVSAICEIADFTSSKGIISIADGGISSTDEIMKAIACGANAVMLGYMLAGCDECPGEVVDIEGEKYKFYRGMGSISAMKDGSMCRYGRLDKSSKMVGEGIESYVKYRGALEDVVFNIEWSLRSAFGYIGAKNISEVHSKSILVKTTSSVISKSNFHSIDKVVSES